MKRREFIILSSVGAASAGVFSACGHPEEKLIPALIPDDEYIPGIDVWKASTCAMCDAGCGILVRTRDHKANKIEGNPAHPVNRGALCARGQAGLQVLYNPDRIKAPMKRVGERGAGQFEEISWDEAIKTLADKLREIKSQGKADKVVFASNDLQGVTGIAVKTFSSAYGAPVLTTAEYAKNLYEASSYQISYGSHYTPVFDIANATYLLSFGARFLETWHSPVRYAQAYGEFRRAKGRTRGKFVQVEPRMSLTGANADEWLPAVIDTEGFVALAIAQVIARENLIKDVTLPKILGLIKDGASAKVSSGSLDDYAPEKTQTITDIPAEKIIRIAREFAGSPHPLAICGGTSAFDGQGKFMAINFLNTLVANVNKPGGVLLSAYATFDVLKNVRSTLPAQQHSDSSKKEVSNAFPHASSNMPADLGNGRQYSALLIHQMNPIFSNPRTADTIKAIPFIASFSSFMDETTQLADLILPDRTFLENWNVKALPLTDKRVAVNFLQPVVKPEFESKQTADVLLALSREFNSEATAFESAEAIVRQAMTPIVNPTGAKEPVSTDEEEESEPVDEFKLIADQGVWVGEVDGITSQNKGVESLTITLANPDESAAIKEDYPFMLFAYEHATLGFGEQANLSVLQELPDPMTSVMWGSWVEINPKTAARFGITDGDVIEVSSHHGTVRAPAVLYPAIRPEVVAMPYGQGHTAYGRYGKDRGVNAIVVNPYAANSDTSAVRVNIKKVSSGGNLIRFGTSLPEHIEIKR
jgi:menaquinone reductase, molybdopterin-binding-like subunit